MTDDEHRIAIAEACGYKRVEVPGGAYGDDGPCKPEPMTYWFEEGWNPGEEIGLPNYLSDLNAMHEAEGILDETQQETYGIAIHSVVVSRNLLTLGRHYHQIAHATAAQRAEAFLKTIGRWKDK